jgi:hypothetical protein
MRCDCNEKGKVFNAFDYLDYVIEEMKENFLFWTKLELLKVKG